MDYPYIRAWGRMLHSFEYYVAAQIAEARADNAPADAIYRNADTGSWVTFASVTDDGTREHVASLVGDMLARAAGRAIEQAHPFGYRSGENEP